MADLKVIAETLVNLTVKEVNELATILKEEYGIERPRSTLFSRALALTNFRLLRPLKSKLVLA